MWQKWSKFDAKAASLWSILAIQIERLAKLLRTKVHKLGFENWSFAYFHFSMKFYPCILWGKLVLKKERIESLYLKHFREKKKLKKKTLTRNCVFSIKLSSFLLQHRFAVEYSSFQRTFQNSKIQNFFSEPEKVSQSLLLFLLLPASTLKQINIYYLFSHWIELFKSHILLNFLLFWRKLKDFVKSQSLSLNLTLNSTYQLLKIQSSLILKMSQYANADSPADFANTQQIRPKGFCISFFLIIFLIMFIFLFFPEK